MKLRYLSLIVLIGLSNITTTLAETLPSKSNPPPELLTQKEIDAGWISLFDGQTLFGWQSETKDWSVKNGVITGVGQKPNLLATTSPFADYELRVEYRLEKGGNSGIFLRTPKSPKNPATDCYEFNLCDSHKSFKTGSLVGRAQPHQVTTGEDGKWHYVVMVFKDRKLSASIDNKNVLRYQDDTEHFRASGLISLQFNQGKIEFKNVAIRPLGLKPMFDGKTLAGWRAVPGAKSQFSVNHKAIHLQKGPGFLETEKTYADFVLQFDSKTHGKHLNSGLFFRAEKGTEKAPSNGYELQIHHTFANEDRSQPNDYKTGFGTGAVFRRQKARWVNADDFKWCKITLVANGNHFASWVNGYQVNNFIDSRKINDNPRRGLRTKAGHISLQGHDDTTDISFRNLNIVNLP